MDDVYILELAFKDENERPKSILTGGKTINDE